MRQWLSKLSDFILDFEHVFWLFIGVLVGVWGQREDPTIFASISNDDLMRWVGYFVLIFFIWAVLSSEDVRRVYFRVIARFKSNS